MLLESYSLLTEIAIIFFIFSVAYGATHALLWLLSFMKGDPKERDI